MASVLLSLFAKDNLAALPRTKQAAVLQTIDRLMEDGLEGVHAQKVVGAPSDAYIVRVDSDIRLMIVHRDRNTLLIDDVFTHR